ncbi:MAG: recombination protein RecR [Planctomycetes bacterium]|nr:recombination protein RecR [Planctomycetota bacterium]MBM4083353.1 recombination protein RecR [Planctomycetota bacterium]
MRGYPQSMTRLMEELAKLPGIGQKTAERLAYHVLRAPSEEAMRLADAIRDVKTNVKSCSVCFNLAEADPCGICQDVRRDRSVICVVEQPRDLIALEKAGQFNGLYHILLGRIAPLEGMDPEHLTIGKLVERVKRDAVKEVILATNPNQEGDATALFIAKALSGSAVKVTRIARGVPAGSYLEYASAPILADAITGRREM